MNCIRNAFSSPINLVDFGTGLFLSKTPSEESGGSGGPHSGGSGGPPMTPATAATDSPHTDSSSFFPTNIISSMGASVGAMGAQVGASVGATVGAVGEAVGASVNAVGGAVNAVGATVGAVGYVHQCWSYTTTPDRVHTRETPRMLGVALQPAKNKHIFILTACT